MTFMGFTLHLKLGSGYGNGQSDQSRTEVEEMVRLMYLLEAMQADPQ
jgi:hypothetical protein